MGGFLIFVGLIALLIGVISLIKPLHFLRITTRKMGVVVLVSGLVILMVGASLSPVEDKSVSVPEEVVEEEPEPEPEVGEIIQFISIGESTSFAEWDYKATDVETHNVIDDERARGQYVVFIIEVTNNAQMDRQVGSLFQAEDEEGRVFSFDSSASLSHHQAYRIDTWHLEDIGPSFTAVMPIVFDVPEDVETLYLYPRDLKEEDFKDTAVIEYELYN